MLTKIKQNLFPALALMIIPCGYFIGTKLRERNDMKKMLEQQQPMDQQDEESIRQQLEALREEREMVLSKLKKQ
ncbi:hypothetical protein A0J61_08277 [Choanephora cucurbitarum]|uniref:Uncharacterized protein n=1 Tax=Choanephora cucurbitarum TaxID=101091 RepID=A0A1C7N3J0_9FUNG|nr:hypothetical protein A0J61_08277 [Choanephora cucurbitarum]